MQPPSLAAATAIASLARWFHQRSRTLVAMLDTKMERLIIGWVFITVTLGTAKVVASPLALQGLGGAAATLLPFLLVSIAPIAGYRVATGSFPRELLSAQPAFRLCRFGAWRKVDPLAARLSPRFGPAGFMASLLVGLLLNVPLRTLEFILAIPAIPPGAPQWAHGLITAMTIDIVVMNFFYMVCFVMAIRSVSLFPRMLVFAWSIDIVMQLLIAQHVSVQPGLPASVSTALHNLLTGNIQKVLISAFIWLPFLILSERVNVTFRQRVPVSRTG